MKRKVTITFEVDATEYHEAEDTPEGVINLVEEMLKNLTDFPDDGLLVVCEGVQHIVYV